jgi:hypothetical protein
MAKHVTEDDLASGLSGFGDDFSTITEKRPRRDSPFRDTRTEAETRGKEEKVIEMRPAAESTIAPAPERDPREDLLARARALQARSAQRPPVREGREPQRSPTRVPTIEESAREVRVTFPEAQEGLEGQATVRKADIFTERVTLSVSTDMRDSVETLARELQRRRTRKDERITANTVMRVAINALLDGFELEDGDVVNTEDELLNLVRRANREGMKDESD